MFDMSDIYRIGLSVTLSHSVCRIMQRTGRYWQVFTVSECLLFRRLLLPCKLLELRPHFICEVVEGRGTCSYTESAAALVCSSYLHVTYSPVRFALRWAAGD